MPGAVQEGAPYTLGSLRRDRPVGPSARFGRIAALASEGNPRQDMGLPGQRRQPALVSRAGVRLSFQGGPGNVKIVASSIALVQISGPGEAVMQRLNLSEVCTTDGGVVYR